MELRPRERQTSLSDGGDDEEYTSPSRKRSTKPTRASRQTTPKKQRLNPEREKSIYDMNIIEINDAFKSALFGQDEVMDRLTGILFEFNQLPVPRPGEENHLILPLLLSGVSGTGKTATAKKIRQFYQVDGAQYIKYDLTRITDDSQVNIILGAGPGLVSSMNRTNLPMDLLRAIGTAPSGKLDTDISEETFLVQKHSATVCKEPPKTIVLHFDEVDKAHPKFLSLMLNFIEEGELTSSGGQKFVLPPETRLIIVFTGNYAHAEIGELCQFRQFREAQSVIREAIERCGVSTAVLGRLPHIMPYFKLEDAISKKIGDCMVTNILDNRNHAYKHLFGHITYTDDTIIDAIKSTFLNNETTVLGMRGLTSGLEEFKGELYFGIANYLLRHPTPTPSVISIDLTTTTIDDEQQITRSRRSKKPLVIKEKASPIPVPQMSYRVFAYPAKELVTLMQLSPDSFPRSVRYNIHERIHSTRSDIGLIMIHNNSQLLTCFLNESLPQQQQQQPTTELAIVPTLSVTLPRRSLLITSPRPPLSEEKRLIEGVVDFSFQRISQYYNQPRLLHFSGRK